MTMPESAQTALFIAQEALKSMGSDASVDYEAPDRLIIRSQASQDTKSITLPCRIGKLLDIVHSMSVKHEEAKTYKIGHYVFISAKALLDTPKGSESIKLTDKETDILVTLIASGKDGCARQTLLEQVWGYRAALDTHTLETHIYRLRQKLEEDPNDPKILLTIEAGYKLIFKAL